MPNKELEKAFVAAEKKIEKLCEESYIDGFEAGFMYAVNAARFALSVTTREVQ